MVGRLLSGYTRHPSIRLLYAKWLFGIAQELRQYSLRDTETSTSGIGVRREKAALSSGCKSHPATAPAGSNRSSYGGNEVAEAFGKRVTKYGDSASV